MSKKEQQQIFTEFTRLNQMKEQVPGLGLGLSIVERIANLLDHSVSLRSKKGKGTRFQVRVDSVAAENIKQEKLTHTKIQKIGQLSGTSILCIDNDQSILDGMETLLTQWGCEIRTAIDLDSALAHARNTTPQIILVDYHLGNTTGVEVYNHILAKCGEHIPGILITADRSEETKALASDAGLSVLNKPVKPAALRALISQNRNTRLAAE